VFVVLLRLKENDMGRLQNQGSKRNKQYKESNNNNNNNNKFLFRLRCYKLNLFSKLWYIDI